MDPSSLFPAEGAVALGLACVPQHLCLSYRGGDRRGLMQQLLKEKNSSGSLLAFALLLITSGVTGMGASVPHVSGSLVVTPTRCF